MISQLAKPDIKGRGFLGSGQEIIETQTYFTRPESDWEFDDQMLLTYNNPVYKDQCKLKGIEIDESGFVQQIPLDQIDKKDTDSDDDDDDDDEDFDDLDDDGDETPEVIPIKRAPKQNRPELPKDGPPMPRMRPDIEAKMAEKKKSEEESSEIKNESESKEKQKISVDDVMSLFDTSDKKKEEDSKSDEDESLNDAINRLFSDDSEDDVKSNVSSESNSISESDIRIPNRNEDIRNKLDKGISTETNVVPVIKLNIDKTALGNKPEQKTIKLNLNIPKKE